MSRPLMARLILWALQLGLCHVVAERPAVLAEMGEEQQSLEHKLLVLAANIRSNALPEELFYPLYSEYGHKVAERLDDLHTRVASHMDGLAHEATMKSSKYGYGLDGLRRSIRNLENSVRSYRKGMHRRFNDQTETMRAELNKGQLWKKSTLDGSTAIPKGIWHPLVEELGKEPADDFSHHSKYRHSVMSGQDGAISANEYHHPDSSSIYKEGYSHGFLNASDPVPPPPATPSSPGRPASPDPPDPGSLLQHEADSPLQFPYSHVKNIGLTVEDRSKKIGEAIDRMTPDIPGMLRKSLDYQHNNFVLQEGVQKLENIDIPALWKTIAREKKQEIHDINQIDWSEAFTARDRKLIESANGDDWNLIKRGKFKSKLEGPDVNFGPNPYQPLSNKPTWASSESFSGSGSVSGNDEKVDLVRPDSLVINIPK